MIRHGRPAAIALAMTLLASPASGQDVTVKSAAPPPADIAELLRPPGSDPYTTPVDWSRVPEWRQTKFFDVRSQGTFFVFVVDCSGSMGDDARLARAKSELRRAVSKLQFPQRYLVIFYNDHAWPMPGGVPESAGKKQADRTFRWFGNVEAEGETDPRGAMKMALSLRPDAVFLLSDGAFPDGASEQIIQANTRKTPVHAIDLSGGAAGPDLEAIAKASGGQYARRP